MAVGDFNRDGRPDVAVANRLSHTITVLLNDGICQVGPTRPGDYNRNGEVDAADSVLWRNTLGATVTPFSGADGDGDGVVDQDDRAVWVANFGRRLPPAATPGVNVATKSELPATPAAELSNEARSVNQQTVKPMEAVEARGETEKQRTRTGLASAFVELLARRATSSVELPHTLRASCTAPAATELNRSNSALLTLLAQTDSVLASGAWGNERLVEFDRDDHSDDSGFEAVDEAYALGISDFTGVIAGDRAVR